MIEDIQNNLEIEQAMAQQLDVFISELASSSENGKRLINEVVRSLQSRIKMLNASIRDLVKIMAVQPLPGTEPKTLVERVEFKNHGTSVAIRRADRSRYLEELSITEEAIRRMRRSSREYEEHIVEFKKANLYGRLSNLLFLKVSTRLVKRPDFKDLVSSLRRSNMRILATTYVSMGLLTTLLSFFFALGIAVFFFMFSLGLESPFIHASTLGVFARLGRTIWIPLAIPALTALTFYFYPYTEQRSVAARIDSELPFVVIHMSSISGSGVEPTQIFKIVGKGKEYKYTRVEMRKLLNQINVYGYDMVNALKNVAAVTPSIKFAELLNGLSTTISSGGDLKIFFEKRAETLLLNYRLERERFAKVAETFMDIYISVVIATPMILLLLLVMISVSGFQIGYDISVMTFGIIVIVALVNVVFLWILSMRQPNY